RVITASPTAFIELAIAAALTAHTGQPILDKALAALVDSTPWPAGVPADLDSQIPEGSLPRSRVALATAIVSQLREAGAQHDAAGALPTGGDRGRDLGQDEEALADKEEALGLWRDLAAANPAHQPDLARALNNRGYSLRDLGYHQQALA